jgi:hypothetical protein
MEFDPEQLEAKMGPALHAISTRHAELNGRLTTTKSAYYD